MLDELDRAYSDRPPRRGRPAPQGGQTRRRPRKKKRRRSFGRRFISFLLLMALGAGVYWGVGKLQDMFGAADYPGDPQQVAVTVTVEPGDTATDIGTELYDKNVVKSVMAFVRACEAEPEYTSIQPGTYQLYEETKASVALAMLLDPDKHMVVTKVTIPEGMISVDIFKKLAKASGLPEADFKEAAKDPVKLGVDPSWFEERDDGTPVRKSIEGFLFPATYSFSPEATAEDMLKEMVATFNSVVTDIDFMDTARTKLNITPYEALIAASIIQAEAVLLEDFPKVAKVLYNRAYTDVAPCNNCLGLDSTVNYWLSITGKGAKASEHLTYAQLHDPKNPYNTHDKPGMPPGAISNPGKDALAAALDPKGSSKVIYFVSVDKEGHILYAETDAQRQRNNQVACDNGFAIDC